VQHAHWEGARAASGIENLAGVDGVEQSGGFALVERVRALGVGEENFQSGLGDRSISGRLRANQPGQVRALC